MPANYNLEHVSPKTVRQWLSIQENYNHSPDKIYTTTERELLSIVETFDKTTWRIGVLVWPKTVYNHHYKNRGSSLAACVNSILGL
jgi:hypothetical protein